MPKWRTMDSAPKDGREILAVCKGAYDDHQVLIVSWQRVTSGREYWTVMSFEEPEEYREWNVAVRYGLATPDEHVLFWMPLPEIPEIPSTH